MKITLKLVSKMAKLKYILSHNAVFFISFAAALISMIFIPPSKEYLNYIDINVIIMLFCLMGVIAAFRSIGVFDIITDFLLKKTVSSRMVAFILMNLCFFTSMFITNDVSLITFVPLTISMASYSKDKLFLIKTLIIETIAANLGSMMTPIGNPHNLYIYSHYNLSAMDFVKTLLPIWLLSYALLTLSILFIKKGEISYTAHKIQKPDKTSLVVYIFLFFICLLAVAGIISKIFCLVITVAALLLCNRKIFLKIDYFLLATFICFFIFVGNISSIPSINTYISEFLTGRETVFSVFLSQIISNVPASVMLSEFTDNATALLAGVNIGGLGTPIASLASLITYRYYSASDNSKKGKFLLIFMIFNFAFLTVLLCAELIIAKNF